MRQTHFKTIVVGVDFSNYSKVVVKQALELTKTQKASLVFVNVLKSAPLTTGEIYFDVENEFIKPLSKELITFYKLKEVAPNAKVVVKIGSASNGIIEMAREVKNPLIVVGHRGKGSFMGRFFLGSTAEQLALHSPFPVWIHRGEEIKIPKKILLPCDFSRRTTASLNLVKSLKGSSKQKYELFHVTQRPLPMLDAAQWTIMMQNIERKEAAHQRQFRKRYSNVPFVKKTGEPASLIFREGKKFDLIAMAPHNREGIFSGFGSVTTKVVRHGNTPILITH